jgi:anti-anti-sigma factor
VLDLVGTIEAAELPSGEFVVWAQGPLDERIAGVLRDTLVPLAGVDGRLVLDLTDAYGVDDAAVEVARRAAHLCARRGGRMSLVTPSPRVAELFGDLTGRDLVHLHPSLREALA